MRTAVDHHPVAGGGEWADCMHGDIRKFSELLQLI